VRVCRRDQVNKEEAIELALRVDANPSVFVEGFEVDDQGAYMILYSFEGTGHPLTARSVQEWETAWRCRRLEIEAWEEFQARRGQP
jgi:hypothetical protein